MRKFIILFIGILALLGFALVSPSVGDGDSDSDSDSHKGGGGHQLPSSLDNFYPPKAKGPVWLIKMFGLSRPFSAIGIDLMEGNIKNVPLDFEMFKKQYKEVSLLIPEWTHDFPQEPVDNLGAALKSGDKKKIFEAMGKVGQVCHHCHEEYMAKVMIKYHWKDFATVKVKDPLSKQELNWNGFKRFLSSSFTGIGVNLQQGQKENAQKQYQGFKARFGALKEACHECHDDKEKNTERKYFVDDNVTALIDQLGQALNASTVDPKAIGKLMQGIGRESCFKCHLVHVPPTILKHEWAKK